MWSGRFVTAILLVCAAVILMGSTPTSNVEPREHGKTAVGKIVTIDGKTASFVVKSAAGESTTMFWNTATKITGANLAVGLSVEVKYLQKGGKNWATSIRVTPVEGSPKQ